MDELGIMLIGVSEDRARAIKDYFYSQKNKWIEAGRQMGLEKAQKIFEEARNNLGREPRRG